jgi:hypothetical protein
MKVIWTLLLICLCTEGIRADRLHRFTRIETRRYERNERIEMRKIKRMKRKSAPLKGAYIPAGYYT